MSEDLGSYIYGRQRDYKVHAARTITLEHIRTWCGLSGSPTNRQFLMTKTDESVDCKACLRNRDGAA